jgi:hypothetical protein
VTHDAVRELLAGYAAGVLSDAHSNVVRAHLAGGCLECLQDVFSRPVGLPLPAEVPPAKVQVTAPLPPVQPRRIRDGRIVAGAFLVSLCSIAVAVSMITERSTRTPDGNAVELTRQLDQTQQLRTSLAGRLAQLERAAASAENMSRAADDMRSSMDELQHDLDAARLRIASLKRALRRQDSDFHEKQQSLEAVIASLSRHVPGGGKTAETACDRVAEPARGICTAFCRVNDCHRNPGAACEPLRARYEELTGAHVPPCDVAIASDTLIPCETSHVNVWSFAVKQGQRYTISADTVEPGTEADLCLVGSCGGHDTFAGDDEMACRSAPGIGCPRATFKAPADASCVVAVTLCSPGCGERESAPYELTIEGTDALTLVARGVPSATDESADATF